MAWLAIIELVLKAVSSVADFLGNRQLLEAGKAQAIREGLQATLDNMSKANAAKTELRDNPDGEYAVSVRDKYERKDSE